MEFLIARKSEQVGLLLSIFYSFAKEPQFQSIFVTNQFQILNCFILGLPLNQFFQEFFFEIFKEIDQRQQIQITKFIINFSINQQETFILKFLLKIFKKVNDGIPQKLIASLYKKILARVDQIGIGQVEECEQYFEFLFSISRISQNFKPSNRILLNTFKKFIYDQGVSQYEGSKKYLYEYLIDNTQNLVGLELQNLINSILRFLPNEKLNIQNKSENENKVGLQNLSAICYINTIMQIFFSIRPFRYGILMAEDGEPDSFQEVDGYRFNDSTFY